MKQDLIRDLRSDSFSLATQDGLWMVNFNMPNCERCENMVDEWLEFAQNERGRVSAGEVNCFQYPDVCRTHHVVDYPTLIFIDRSRKDSDQLQWYTGERTSEAMSEFISKILKGEVDNNMLDANDVVQEQD